MPRNYIKKTNVIWTEKGLKDALTEREAAGTSFRKLSKKYNIPLGTLHRQLAVRNKGLSGREHRGRKSVFSIQEEDQLKRCIVDMAALGFAPTLREVGDLVHSYVEFNEIERARKVFRHKGKPGYPGPDWMDSFLTRNKLSLKEATKLCVSRHNATRNPFIVNHFYDLLEKTVKELNIEDRPDLIWNADESGLPYEPKRCRVVSGKGQKTLQIVTGSDRENITVLAACSAVGVALPPLIINQGQHVQSTWRPNMPVDSKYYPWQYANSSGWMKSDIFFKWFQKFEEVTRSYDECTSEVEPCILIYDGHMSHMWYGTLELARENKITIIKLPPHTTGTPPTVGCRGV